MVPPVLLLDRGRFSRPSDWVEVGPGVFEASFVRRDGIRVTIRRGGSGQCKICGDPLMVEEAPMRYCSTCFHREWAVMNGKGSVNEREMVEAYWEREGLDRGRKMVVKELRQTTLG